MSTPIRLILMRHGPAENRDAVRWPNDDLRPLTERGENKVKLVMRTLCKRPSWIPTRILCSPLTRTRKTAEIAAKVLHLEKSDIRDWPSLRPEANPLLTLPLLGKSRLKGPIMLVGHEPWLGEFIGICCAGQSGPGFPMRKAGLACIEFSVFKPGSGQLIAFFAPNDFILPKT